MQAVSGTREPLEFSACAVIRDFVAFVAFAIHNANPGIPPCADTTGHNGSVAFFTRMQTHSLSALLPCNTVAFAATVHVCAY